MIPFATETVTLLKRVETQIDRRTHVSYERRLLTGCSWRRTSSWTQMDTEMRRTETVTCRIPLGQARPEPGDYLFLGDVPTDGDPAELLTVHRATGAFRIGSVGDHTLPGTPIPHYAARSDAM